MTPNENLINMQNILLNNSSCYQTWLTVTWLLTSRYSVDLSVVYDVCSRNMENWNEVQIDVGVM